MTNIDAHSESATCDACSTKMRADANAIFEGLGRLYYDRYRRLRPGKDEPAISGRDSMDDDNIRQFSRWTKYEALDDAILHIDALREIVRDISTMDCFYSGGPCGPDCQCLAARASRALG